MSEVPNFRSFPKFPKLFIKSTDFYRQVYYGYVSSSNNPTSSTQILERVEVFGEMLCPALALCVLEFDSVMFIFFIYILLVTLVS